jgi:hypothetical protein
MITNTLFNDSEIELSTSSQELLVRKTKRILVYPNITAKNYEQDSYVDVLAMQIAALNEIRDDLFFYIISPEGYEIERLKFHNTHQFPIAKIPTHSPTMRVYFDVEALKPIFKMQNFDFDMIYSHLPEHTLNIVNSFHYKTHFEPAIFGYCHWFDFPGVMTWKHTFMNNITGLLEMQKCFLNTQSQKELVLKKMEGIYAQETIDQVNKILEPNYLGIQEKDIADSIVESTEKIIAFPHRPWGYKDYKNFLSICDQLYKRRQDFKVWVPLEKKIPRPYVFNTKYPKEKYYEELGKCRVGFSPKQNYKGWSIATTDGMMKGCPFIMYDDGYYREMNPKADFFSNNNEAVDLLEKYLDDEPYRNWQAQNSLDEAQNLIYINRSVNPLSKTIDSVYESINRVKSPDKVEEIKKHIREAGVISKKDLMKKMGWGVAIKWNKYRSAVLDDPEIFDVIDKEPKYVYRANN